MKGGRVVGAARAAAAASMSRGEIDAYTEFVKIYGAKGLAWIKVNDAAKGREGLQSPIVKNLHDARAGRDHRAHRRAQRRPDLLRRRQGQGGQRRASARCASRSATASSASSTACSRTRWAPLWVVDFPMFEYDEDGQRWIAVHHPFTAPKDGHEDLMDTDPSRCIAKAYDMVLNGMGDWAAARCVSTARKCRARCSAR